MLSVQAQAGSRLPSLQSIYFYSIYVYKDTFQCTLYLTQIPLGMATLKSIQMTFNLRDLYHTLSTFFYSIVQDWYVDICRQFVVFH